MNLASQSHTSVIWFHRFPMEPMELVPQVFSDFFWFHRFLVPQVCFGSIGFWFHWFVLVPVVCFGSTGFGATTTAKSKPANHIGACFLLSFCYFCLPETKKNPPAAGFQFSSKLIFKYYYRIHISMKSIRLPQSSTLSVQHTLDIFFTKSPNHFYSESIGLSFPGIAISINPPMRIEISGFSPSP